MKILCLDVGEKRIGVARSDELGLLAHGMGVIERKSDPAAIERLLDLLKEWSIEKIVVGQPKRMDGSLGIQVTRIGEFVEKLRKKTDVTIEWWDERLTTQSAEKFLLAADLSRRRRKEVRDQLAAQIILQDFLDHHRRR